MSTADSTGAANQAAIARSMASCHTYKHKMDHDGNMSGLLYDAGKAAVAPEAMKKDSMAGHLRFEENLANMPGIGVGVAVNRALAGERTTALQVWPRAVCKPGAARPLPGMHQR